MVSWAGEEEDWDAHVDVFEVKRHADAHSVAQLANYLVLTRKHIYAAGQEHYLKPGGDAIAPHGWLFALTFDRAVYPLAHEANITLKRITVGSDGQLGVEHEDSYDLGVPSDPAFTRLMFGEIRRLQALGPVEDVSPEEVVDRGAD